MNYVNINIIYIIWLVGEVVQTHILGISLVLAWTLGKCSRLSLRRWSPRQNEFGWLSANSSVKTWRWRNMWKYHGATWSALSSHFLVSHLALGYFCFPEPSPSCSISTSYCAFSCSYKPPSLNFTHRLCQPIPQTFWRFQLWLQTPGMGSVSLAHPVLLKCYLSV